MHPQTLSPNKTIARIFACILTLSAIFALAACGQADDPYPFKIHVIQYNYNPNSDERDDKSDKEYYSIILEPDEDLEILATRIDGIDSDGKTWMPDINKFSCKKGEECRLFTEVVGRMEAKLLKIFTDKGAWIIDVDQTWDSKTNTTKQSPNFLKGEKINETLDPKALKKAENWIR